MDNDTIIRLATEDAAKAIDAARSNPGPIVWITGNSYMPPLRDFGQAETVWQVDDDPDAWSFYVETFERLLDEASVYLGCPDYDNALYVVDQLRWEYIDEPDDVETLTDEWAPRICHDEPTPFRVCEDCGSNQGVKLITWDGKNVPMCADCREMHGITAA